MDPLLPKRRGKGAAHKNNDLQEPLLPHDIAIQFGPLLTGEGENVLWVEEAKGEGEVRDDIAGIMIDGSMEDGNDRNVGALPLANAPPEINAGAHIVPIRNPLVVKEPELVQLAELDANDLVLQATDQIDRILVLSPYLAPVNRASIVRFMQELHCRAGEYVVGRRGGAVAVDFDLFVALSNGYNAGIANTLERFDCEAALHDVHCLALLNRYKHKEELPTRAVLQWSTLTAVFRPTHMLVYHKLAREFSVVGYRVQGMQGAPGALPSFWKESMFFGPLNQKDRRLVEHLLPAGAIPGALVRQLHDLVHSSGLEYRYNPIISFTDLHDYPLPVLIFTIDCPRLLMEPLLIQLHAHLLAAFHVEFAQLGALEYDIYRHDLPEDLIKVVQEHQQ